MIRVGGLFFVALLGSCARSDRDRDWVARSLREHGASQVATSTPPQTVLAERAADGLDEREVVAIALALNPTYRADLTRIDAARADLAEARTVANPQISVVDAAGPISAFAALLAPVDSLWQMPRRSQAAARALEAVAESLVQSGLDLARDVRLAHAQRGLAEERARVLGQLSAAWDELARLGDVRERAGESTPAEADGLRAEAAIARDALQISRTELVVARTRLRTVLGLDPHAQRFAIQFTREPFVPPSLHALAKIARRARPDVRVSELALEAAAARAGYERSRVVSIAALVEGHWTQSSLPAARWGARLELPIFGANPGGIGRANADVTRAEAQVVEIRRRVMLEIVQARALAEQAFASLETYRDHVLPPLHAALLAATRNYELGEETYSVVLDVQRRIGQARLREAELIAEWRRGDAELERATGARIGAK